MKVLLVEYDTKVGNLLTHKLTRSGYQVQWFSDEDRVRRSLSAFAPDLVILETALPGLNGVELLRTIKSDPATLSMQVLMCTANADPDTVRECVRLGAADYLVKPLAPEKVVQRVTRLLHGKAAADLGAVAAAPQAG